MRNNPKNVFLFVLILSLGIAPLSAAEVVEIPDPNLRTAIEGELGKDAGAPITKAEMATLTQLEAPDANIRDLTGLEGATNLTFLWLYDNNISDISPLAGSTKLKWLDLINNDISDLSALAGLTQLIRLDLSDNTISDLSPLAGLTQLEELYLFDNIISDLSPLAGLTNLTWLSLRGNPLNAMAFETHIPAHQSRGTEVHFDPPKADVNGDGVVNIFDLVRVANAFGTDAEANPAMDVNTDGEINILDLVTVANFFAKAQ